MKEKFKSLMPYLLVILLVFGIYQRRIVLRFRNNIHESVQSRLTEFVKEVRNAPYDEITYANLYANIETAVQLYETYALSGARSSKESDNFLLGLAVEIRYLLKNNRTAIENTFTPDSEATVLLYNIATNLNDNKSIIKLIEILESKYY